MGWCSFPPNIFSEITRLHGLGKGLKTDVIELDNQ